MLGTAQERDESKCTHMHRPLAVLCQLGHLERLNSIGASSKHPAFPLLAPGCTLCPRSPVSQFRGNSAEALL